MKQKPDLTFWQIWNLSFGFFGVQIAYSLQNANVSRIFSTLGADPKSLSYFWILPPLMGLIVQPIVGTLSDRTWNRFGRRIPYLIVGALISVVVMCMLPNAGSFGLAIGLAMMFGVITLMLLDTSLNMAMQPFKMLVGDMVNERQKGFAYSIQSFLVNGGSLLGFLLPFILTWIGFSNTAEEGVVPNSLIYAFYIGAAILILCVLYTVLKVKEMPPHEYAQYHGIEEKPQKKEKINWIQLLKKAPSVFWTVGLVQFFSWAAFFFMWVYTTGAIADNVWETTDPKSVDYQNAGDWTGVVMAVQSVGAVLWALVIPRFKSHKTAYIVSLLIGAVGFISTLFVHDQYLLFVSYFLIGCAWAVMLALPFTILTNALSGSNMGAYLGLFNGTICVPQIFAGLTGGLILILIGGSQINMLLVSGISLIIAAVCVQFIKETYGSETKNIAES